MDAGYLMQEKYNIAGSSNGVNVCLVCLALQASSVSFTSTHILIRVYLNILNVITTRYEIIG